MISRSMNAKKVKSAYGGGGKVAKNKKENKKLNVLDFVEARDYTGAIALLEFQRRSEEADGSTIPWLGYCNFHLGDFKAALDAYEEMENEGKVPEEIHLYKACCLFYLQMFEEAEKEAMKGPDIPLRNRLMFHISHKLGNETKLMTYHQKLTDTTEDQLALAAIHYFRNHFQEATDIYKRLLLENRDDLALNVYVAMCYYKLDYYDVALEILAVYLQTHPSSSIAINLKACNHFRLYNGKEAENELKTLTDQGGNINENDLVRHNLVVFRDGQNALQVLPSLVDFLPEARLNLVIYYLRNDEIQEAFDLIKDLEPATPPEYILKGVVHAAIGQETGSREHIKMAQQFFQLVGASASECDTIPGRQCMGSCFFLLKQFDDVNIYLKSIMAYLNSDDAFNWNYGISLAASGNYADGEETLLRVQNEKFRNQYCYVSWLARCHIRNKKNAQLAWELYLRMETSAEAFNLLQLIANDCYKAGCFYYAAKAFDVLERLDPDPEYWEGKRGACIGLFQQVIAEKESKEKLPEAVTMLRNTINPQVEYITRTMKKWCKDNGVPIA